MSWKVEKWLEEVFPGRDEIYSKYKDLPTRDLIITAAASLDLALAQLISKRLLDEPKECDSFLGTSFEGMSPCGSFGARIQLAFLLGIITKSDSLFLKNLKNMRNLFAHRVNITLTEGPGLKESYKLLENYRNLMSRLLPHRKAELYNVNLNDIMSDLPEKEDYVEGVLLGMFSIYQAYFHKMFDSIERIEKPKFITDESIEY